MEFRIQAKAIKTRFSFLLLPLMRIWHFHMLHHAGPFLNVRSSLGVTPAMLDKEPVSPPPAQKSPVSRPRTHLTRKSYQQFSKTRKNLMQASSRVRLQSRAVEFRRIWWDKQAKAASRLGISIWRPSPPSGYMSLGKDS